MGGVSLYLRKKIKPVNQYQVWVVSGHSHADGFLDDDILGVYESLGNRGASEVIIENNTIGSGVGSGYARVRLNVSKKIYQPYNQFHNNWLGVGQGLGVTSAVLVAEIEECRPDLDIYNGTSVVINRTEIAVNDIKIVTATSGLRIIVT